MLGKLQNTGSHMNIITKRLSESSKCWKPLVIIIPLRLGLNDVNKEYIDQLKVNIYISDHSKVTIDVSSI
jgi:hypothetical protein